MLVGLALISLAGGVGITALGPGGVLPTIGLFALTGLSAPVVAGTALVTHVATGIAGTAAFTRSGQLRRPHIRRTALILAAAAAVGTPLGVLVNAHLSQRAFGYVLAVVVAAVALLLWYRERAGVGRAAADHAAAPVPEHHPGTAAIAGIGAVVAVTGGIVGIGGPMLAVPLLIACGVPVLESLAAAQAQSIVIAAVGSVGYAAQGAIDWPLALLVGVPELAGVFLGWRIAHALPTRTLKRALIVALLVLAPYLAATA
ncbi:sulfite exporter TauE/SafE family protein [Tomitella fengzijianii]|uniref:sulfite exporter TauE/SafE family protein n=1 Tax=Tomitella fengzijianii TaxID=2597660 RepID=UPI001E5E0E12|nr:sulfite exporter TauE/SafE family protein [Tomitella fengzijianii]